MPSLTNHRYTWQPYTPSKAEMELSKSTLEDAGSRSESLIRPHSSRKRPSGIASDWFSDDDDEDDEGDELSQSFAGPRPQGLTVEDSPIPWWLMQRKRWPRLSSLALDISAVPAVSDASERLFSQAGDATSSRRRLLHSPTIEWLMSLKNWISTGIVRLDDDLFGGPTVSSEGGGKSGDTSLFSGDDEVTVLGKQANSTNNQ
ncbi:Hypothetical protein D9617_95g039920 [Elsinoe fawcettii]|nr:Hypothetical protein D9617_95g039920 [Elsinoe fawcettii]